MTAIEVPGWSVDVRPWFDFILPRIRRGGVYLEVGTFLGSSLAYVGEKRPDLQLVAVDPWIDDNHAPDPATGWAGPGIFAEDVARSGCLFFAFLDHMRHYLPDVLKRTQILRGTSETVAYKGTIDLLFIDGHHSYEAVRSDLATFGPRVRLDGGVVAGHDYDWYWDNGGLCRAVDEMIGQRPQLGTPDGQAMTTWWHTIDVRL